MYHFEINNPNNLFIDVNSEYIPVTFGSRCTSALACKSSGIRKFSLPFDWTIPLFPRKIKKVLENNFENFLPDVRNGKFRNIYDIGLAHFDSDINNGINMYKRRIDRFNSIMNNTKKKYFIYINEDYIYNKNYREDKFNDEIFRDLIELEKYIKEQYNNIDYNILFFNFKHHNIPENSNIINIVLTTSYKFVDNEYMCVDKMIPNFRIFCGEILAKLFNTKFIHNYDINFNE